MFSFIMDKDNNHDNDYDHTSSLSLTTLSSPPSTPSAAAAEDAVVAGARLYRARLIVENQLYDQLISRYRLAITRLREVTREANALQEENEWLRLANEDLGRRLVGPAATGDSSSPRSVMMNSNGDYNNIDERFTLPKSISVPSPGYFKLVTPPNPPSPGPSPRVNGTKLRVQREEKAVEMEVYNQGMYKTELCNKWQETATCPYGNNCRFAHGISELRPVIRHPRYKTQVCRMVLTGATCPYGHRCHFRHALAATTTTTTTRLSS